MVSWLAHLSREGILMLHEATLSSPLCSVLVKTTRRNSVRLPTVHPGLLCPTRREICSFRRISRHNIDHELQVNFTLLQMKEERSQRFHFLWGQKIYQVISNIYVLKSLQEANRITTWTATFCHFTFASSKLMFFCWKLKLMNSLQLKVNFLPKRKEENCSKLCRAAECVTLKQFTYFMVSHTIFLVNSIIVFLYVTWPNRCTT